MVEVNPPEFQGANCYTFEDFRQAFGGVVCVEGVAGTGDLLVTAVGGASINVNVAAGSAWVDGDLNGSSGSYYVTNDASVPVTIAANGAGSSRIDLIVASVYDSQYIGAADNWAIEVVQGVAGGGTPAVPTSTRSGYIILGSVTVPASGGTPSVVDDSVRQHMSTCGVDPYCELTNTAATSVPNNTTTKATLATTVHNDPGFFSVASSVITVLQDGLYDLHATGGYALSTVPCEFDLTISGVAGTNVYTNDVTAWATVTGRIQVPLTAGTNLQLNCYQNQSSGSLAVNTLGAGLMRLTVRKVG